MAGRPATLEDENVFGVAIEESTSCKVFSEQRGLSNTDNAKPIYLVFYSRCSENDLTRPARNPYP